MYLWIALKALWTINRAVHRLTQNGLAKRLPRYPNVPAVRMGRLAVDHRFRGKGLGAALLADALRRSASAEIAAFAFVVDAKDKAAADFYAHHGFRATNGKPMFLYLALATVKDLVRPP
ncbi:MAG: GNAT family N-acetyltransferase [Bacteroidetes bacterium]|nr:GNAT family N-acetyltransferase [Betaproteobacteria bacterium]NBU73504.1 GNAT family N-acetyltransferase [Bacteroidota bacterium]